MSRAPVHQPKSNYSWKACLPHALKSFLVSWVKKKKKVLKESRETGVKGFTRCEWTWLQVCAPHSTLRLGAPWQWQPAGVKPDWAAQSLALRRRPWVNPRSGLPESRDTGSVQSSSKMAFLGWTSGKQACLFSFFLLAFLWYFSPNISFVAENYIPNGVILSAVLYTVLLFKELARILTALQAGNLVGTLLSCLLI